MIKRFLLPLFLIISLCGLLLFVSFGKQFPFLFSGKEDPKTPPLEQDWAESRLRKMSLEEKIAQLIMIRVHSNYAPEVLDLITEQVEKHQPGGVCFFQGGPGRQIDLTNKFQKLSRIPMLIAIDGEWGPAMRLDSCIAFPRQMTLGAMDESGNDLIYEMGKEIGRQCQALGIHINFAPVVDINNNPNNPVINSRSFGESRETVAEKSILYMRGMQDVGVSACAKHFPGHGDTETDSHHDLPVISKSIRELDSLELYPFQQVINQGIDMVMVSHLNIPALDPSENSISTLSFNTITMKLKKEMAFDGIVITDAMDMLGLRNSHPEGGEAEIIALLAGIDLLLLPNELDIVIPAIKSAVETGLIPEELIDEKCLKILRFKESKGVNRFRKIPSKDLNSKLNSDYASKTVDKMMEKAITLLKNGEDIIPVLPENISRTALLCIGGETDSATLRNLCREHGLDFIQTSRSINGKSAGIIQKLEPYSHVIVSVLSTNQSPRYHYGVYKETIRFMNELSGKKKVILALYGNPYSLKLFENQNRIPVILIGYESTIPAFKAGLKAILGKSSFEGTLPVSIDRYALHSGIRILNTELETPAAYSSLSRPYTEIIDSVINDGIKNHIFPGCQVIAIHKGKTVYNKAHGYHTYEKKRPTADTDLYDLASVTKIAATTLAVMRLYEEGRIKLSDKIGPWLPYLQETDKANITIEELLTHTSGLPAYIPFYKELVSNNQWDTQYLNTTKTPRFCIEVTDHLFLAQEYPDEIRSRLAKCKIGKKEYKYSDLGFILLKDIVEMITKESFEYYLQKEFYIPLGLKNTCFNPLRNAISPDRIAPTENDAYFRMQPIQGHVHDQTAAMFGGICGHAGLFSNTRDLAVLFQMLMDGGVYNGKRYFKSETVKLFTSTRTIHGSKRRALGFDTPGFEKKSSVLPVDAGKYTYGHQGFTGTVVWCDPENALIYIFLSNRVHPDAEPNKLAKSRIRLILHENIYKSIS